jgi:hypothetical protein
MFIQKCFIKDSSQYLCDVLERRGYRKNTLCSFDNVGNDTEDWGIACENGAYFLVREICLLPGFVNCGKHKALFLSIASMQDISDLNQWFKFDNGDVAFCECESRIDMWGDYEEGEIPLVKMTSEELVEMFIGKKDSIFFCVDTEGWGWLSREIPVRRAMDTGWKFEDPFEPISPGGIKLLGLPELTYGDAPVEIEVLVKVKM